MLTYSRDNGDGKEQCPCEVPLVARPVGVVHGRAVLAVVAEAKDVVAEGHDYLQGEGQTCQFSPVTKTHVWLPQKTYFRCAVMIFVIGSDQLSSIYLQVKK